MGVIAPGQVQVKQTALAVAFTAAFATSGFNYTTTFTKIADAISAFWLLPPMAFLGPTPGVVIAAPAKPLRDAFVFGHVLSTHLSDDASSVSPGQTVFTASEDPEGSVNFVLNGMMQRAGIDFRVSGTGVDWISPDFSLSPGDLVDLQYLTTTVMRDNIDPQSDTTAAVAATHWAWALHLWSTSSIVVQHAPPSASTGPLT